jgi:hypothetical protein
MRDLKPYICSYGGCPEEARMFRRRRDWFQHELDVHRIYWECPRGCSEPMSSENDFKLHMFHSHQTRLTHEQIGCLTKAMAKQQDGRHKTNCGLCRKEYLVNETLRRHLGGEMEEIALFVMPRQHDFRDGSDGSGDTDASDSTGELVEEPTFSGNSKAITAYLADNTLKEGLSAAHFSPDIAEQKAVDLEKRPLQRDNALDSIEETLSVLPNTTDETIRDLPTKAAVETDSPDPKGEFWIPEYSPDGSCDEPFQEGFNNLAADSDPAAADQISTSESPALFLSDSVLQESRIVLSTADSFEDIENDVEWLQPIRPELRPIFVAEKSPEIAYRTDYEENFGTEFDQYDPTIHNSQSASEADPEDVSSDHWRFDTSSCDAHGFSENDDPVSNTPLEYPPSPSLGVASPESIPPSSASPFSAFWYGTPPTNHSYREGDPSTKNRTEGPSPADTYQPGSEVSPRWSTEDLDRDLPPKMPATPRLMNRSLPMAPPGPSAAPAFKCTHPGCTAAPFQTQYLLDSHANVHLTACEHYCPLKGCPRGIGGKGFKTKNEMIRHGLVYDSQGYLCPYCLDNQHVYSRPDNLETYISFYFEDSDGVHANTFSDTFASITLRQKAMTLNV